MCGIAGIISPDGFDPRTLMSMTHLVDYRGPSGFGFAYSQGADSPVECFHNENRAPAATRPVVGLGNRRLSILDVSAAGNMPMLSDDGSLCVTFNGEIYNFKEIRLDLERRGHRFRSRSDTEVILHAYQQWGEDCLAAFNGMWSFALWDRSRQTLFCARDRFGVKPFYYAVVDGRFYCASEIKQILEASAMPRAANPQAVSRFLEWGLLDDSRETFFNGISQLPGSHFLRVHLAGSIQLQVQKYWELQITPKPARTVEDATEEFQELFEDAVKIRLRSDVPVGVCLSGGLDSSAVISQAKKIAPETRFESFSACFEDPGLDEREYIAAMVSSVECEGHLTYPQGASFWKTIESIIYHQDEPLLSAGAFLQWSVMEEAKKRGVPVLLGGQGADEALCGYQKYRYFYLWRLLRNADPLFIWEAALSMRNGTRSYWSAGSVSRYLPAVFRAPFSVTKRLGTVDSQSTANLIQTGLGIGSGIAERQRADLLVTSIPTLVHHEDRISMAHSVETRLPFLDYRLVEFAVNCPDALKLRNGWSKWILRNALVDALPEKVRLRKTKLGFNAPDAKWLRIGLQNGHRDLWAKPGLLMEKFLNPKQFAHECQKFLNGSATALPANLIFRALSLELWARVFNVS